VNHDTVATGVAGLDHLLHGGLPANRLYLVQGDPGVGKTTLALQFLLEGVAQGERTMYVTFSETRDELESVIRSHGWSSDGIEVFEFTATQEALAGERAGTVFHPAETELSAVTSRVWAALERARPRRLVFDSISELRLLAGDALRYRRQLLEIKSRVGSCTTLLLDDRTATRDDLQLQSLAHGVISLYRIPSDYGSARRRLEIVKLRGMDFRDGLHDVAIRTGGLIVFPRLVASDHAQLERGTLPSGVPGLDALVGGGIDRGSGTLLLGPAGVGKSTVALKFALSAADRGERAIVYNFDESLGMVRARAAGVGMSLSKYEDAGTITLCPVDAADLSPGQFAWDFRQRVEKEGIRVVIIDSLNGYLNAMPAEKQLILHLHELLAYASAKGVAVLMVISQHGIMGAQSQQPLDASYLADTVFLFRYYEFRGELRQAISVFKRRGGAHERAIRELTLGPPDGVSVGESLHDFSGVLTGTPVFQPARDRKE
jgi:circadian clock protein KaiC